MATEISDKAWELSHYEENRKCQSLMANNKNRAGVSPKAVHSDLRCPICLDLLNTTMTTKECLHRFCAECIITALRSGNKECPTCRKKLVSKRSLRPDPNFDQLVAKLYPDKEETDEHQEKAGFVHAKRLCKKRYPEDDNLEEPEIKKLNKMCRFRLSFNKENSCVPSEETVNKIQKERYVETSSSATVEHLTVFIRNRVEIELGIFANKVEADSDSDCKSFEKNKLSNVRVFTDSNAGESQHLSNKDITLQELEDLKQTENIPLELYFTCDISK